MSNINAKWRPVAADQQKFFYEVDLGDGESERRMGLLRKVVIAVDFFRDGKHVETVAFIKTNRGKTYMDSRNKKKRISASELLDELTRWLGSYEAEQAKRTLDWG